MESLVRQPASGVDSLVIPHGGFRVLSPRGPVHRQAAECWPVLGSGVLNSAVCSFSIADEAELRAAQRLPKSLSGKEDGESSHPAL